MGSGSATLSQGSIKYKCYCFMISFHRSKTLNSQTRLFATTPYFRKVSHSPLHQIYSDAAKMKNHLQQNGQEE